jgi:hypothetical protein
MSRGANNYEHVLLLAAGFPGQLLPKIWIPAESLGRDNTYLTNRARRNVIYAKPSEASFYPSLDVAVEGIAMQAAH